MSVQFGRWNRDGRPVEASYLEKARVLLSPYGPDDGGSYAKANIGILYRALHTTKESRRESQPHPSGSGAVITWDGRLDNRAELIRELRHVLAINATDVSIAAAAYDTWGTKCLGRFIGDWALSVWNPNDRTLLLAKDPIGSRHLYYSLDKDQVSWSTVLDPLVLLARKTFTLEKEYIAGWLSFFPATHLTPYVGIHSVPPASFVRVSAGALRICQYWDFDPSLKIRYRADAEYEEHFRAVFGESVRRRLRSDDPVLAELSGGMDSSSIVCMADALITRGGAETPRLDTISYYDDSEPNWNERPYFAKVEEQRGRTGCHINFASRELFKLHPEDDGFAAIPGAGRKNTGPTGAFAAFLQSCGARVVLSGIGGDEVMGGVPTPGPELEDLIARARLLQLAHRLKVWALNKRKPWIHLLAEVVGRFLPRVLAGVPRYRRPVPWLDPQFAKRLRAALEGYERRVRLFGPSPTFQENIAALDALRRQLACESLSAEPPYEKRYPYLDRDLLAFVYAIPREQLVRPGQRRSLMRRALGGIVPDDLLHRKRKAFVVRAPMVAISAEFPGLAAMAEEMVTGFLDIVSPARFLEALHHTRSGQDVPIVPLLRTLHVEFWLRNLRSRGVLDGLMRGIQRRNGASRREGLLS